MIWGVVNNSNNFFRFIHQCCETICLAATDFYNELIKYDDLIIKIIDFLKLESGNLNHLLVSFYSKIIISLLSVENGVFLDYLEKSDFLENCFNNLKFCSIFELLCAIPNCLPLNEYRVKVKQVCLKKA